METRLRFMIFTENQSREETPEKIKKIKLKLRAHLRIF